MLGAALLSALPRKSVRIVGFVLLLAGVFITGFSVGLFYLPTFFAFVWVMVRDERLAPAFVAKGTPQRDETHTFFRRVLPAFRPILPDTVQSRRVRGTSAGTIP
jgi:hypothetical protein